MKFVKSILIFFLMGIVLLSCEKSNKQQKTEVVAKVPLKEMAANVKKVSLEIDGMTCQIGCAKTIQSKLAKVKGVNYVSVNFEDKKGIVEYDANKLSKKDIVSTVEKIAGGDLYKVTEVVETE